MGDPVLTLSGILAAIVIGFLLEIGAWLWRKVCARYGW